MPEYLLEAIIDEKKKQNIAYFEDKIDVMKEDNKTFSFYRYVLNNYNTKEQFDLFLDKFSIIDQNNAMDFLNVIIKESQGSKSKQEKKMNELM